MTIAATRMHRSLVDFASRSTDVYDVLSVVFPAHCGQCRFSTPHNLRNNSLPTPEFKRSNATSIPMDRMEVAVHVVSEQHGTPRMKDDNLSISTNEQMHEKPNGLNRDDDVGRRV
jgi:hypothetical protein